MSNVSVTNTFVDGTTITASGHNQNFSDIVNYINNRNDGSTAWDILKVTNSSSVPLVVNNGAGTNDIANLQDNGTNVVAVADGGATTITATAGGSSVPLTVNNNTSTGNILNLKDNGTDVLTVADGGLVTITSNSASANALVVTNNTSTGSVAVFQDGGNTLLDIQDSGTCVFRTDGGSSVGVTIDNGTSTGDILQLKDSGTAIHTFSDGGAVIFNELGNDADFRIESDTNPNMFFVDASADCVGIGTSTPISRLDVKQGTDLHLLIAGETGVTGSISINTVNDANNSNIPLEIRSSYTGFTSGSIGIGTGSETTSALVELVSTTKGFLPPRMTTTNRNNISSPAIGLVIYNTSTNKLNVYTGSWEAVTSA